MSRALDDLAPDVQAKAEALLAGAAARSIPLIVVQTLRTDEEQAALYAKGRTRPGPIVTKAKAGQSWHNELGPERKARAFDVAFRTPDGGVTWKGPWATVGALGESLGLEWGGRWPGFPDKPHFQDKGGMTLAQARALARTPAAA